MRFWKVDLTQWTKSQQGFRLLPTVPIINCRKAGLELGFIREGRGVRQEAVASIVGIDKSTLSKIENGKRALKIEEFCLFAQALGQQPGDLLPHTEGIPLRYRPLIQALDGKSDAEIEKLMKLVNLIFDVEGSKTSPFVTTSHRQKPDDEPGGSDEGSDPLVRR